MAFENGGNVNSKCINPSPPSAACMRQWPGSALVQVMACRLFGAKPFPEPMLAFCQFDSREKKSVKFESEFSHFRSRKCIWNCRLPKWRPFCPGGMSQSLHRIPDRNALYSTRRRWNNWLAFPVPSGYMNQWWHFNNWTLENRVQLNLNKIKVSFKKVNSQMSPANVIKSNDVIQKGRSEIFNQ